ncbi:MAG: hypothetical protein LQ350_006696 [Teloschistes chrysophthalmus]|nr:MAG: hypothetical protein LQ350_006696 [Niorma chrysophthalma]
MSADHCVDPTTEISRVSRPDLLKGADKKDQWEDKEADTYADDKEEEPNSNNFKNQTPSLRSTKKRSLSTAGEKSQVKGIERGRLSSWLSSDEETETGDESDSSTYIPCTPSTPSTSHAIAFPRPTSSYSTGLKGDLSGDDGVPGFVGGRSRTAVIYEQQGWEEEITRKGMRS